MNSQLETLVKNQPYPPREIKLAYRCLKCQEAVLVAIELAYLTRCPLRVATEIILLRQGGANDKASYQ
jgi:hypothetical protein